jgi:7-keto-8-aminopelargonate synthetase-like enzyme
MEILSQEKEVFYDLIRQAEDIGVSHLNLDTENFTGRYIYIDGKKLLYFADCSYLGLENDTRLIEAAHRAAKMYGIILSNSRSFLSSPLYKELQSLVNEIMPGHSLITTTTTLGHCSTLPLIIDKEDLIIMDVHVHNSIQMAAKLCSANGTRIKYLRNHNNMQKLEDMVNHPENAKYKKIWFLGDGIYSMQGEFIDLTGLKNVLEKKENLFAYIDDAHGFGWTGNNGAGFILGDSKELHPKMIVAVSMCKSFGCAGGIITFPNKSLRDRVDLIGQTQIFSAPIANPVLGAAIASAKIYLSPEIEEYQQELMNLIAYFKKKCKCEKIPLNTKSETPIQFIEIGKSEKVYEASSKLMDYGIYCSIAAYPSMPKNHGGLRISLTRHLKIEDIDYLIDTLKEILE